MRVALVHEWLITHGGSEEITAELQAVFPDAAQFALESLNLRGRFAARSEEHTSELQSH